jgi:hypothetical protein
MITANNSFLTILVHCRRHRRLLLPHPRNNAFSRHSISLQSLSECEETKTNNQTNTTTTVTNSNSNSKTTNKQEDEKFNQKFQKQRRKFQLGN